MKRVTSKKIASLRKNAHVAAASLISVSPVSDFSSLPDWLQELWNKDAALARRAENYCRANGMKF